MKRTIKQIAGQLLVTILLLSGFSALGQEKEEETYHILQKGYIRVEGGTNFFNFSGKSLLNSGKLEESATGDYTGIVTLRFDQILSEPTFFGCKELRHLRPLSD